MRYCIQNNRKNGQTERWKTKHACSYGYCWCEGIKAWKEEKKNSYQWKSDIKQTDTSSPGKQQKKRKNANMPR